MLCLGKEKSSKCSETNGFSIGFNDGMRRNIGIFLSACCFLSADAFVCKIYFMSPVCMCVKYATSSQEFKTDVFFLV